MKRVMVSIISLVFVLSIVCVATAEMQPFANQYFYEASVAFNNQGKSVFTATTTFQFNNLSVTSCVLQMKSGNTWINSQTLTPPSTTASQRYTYSAEKTYSLNCVSGKTYRLKAIFNADGHTITRYSNEVRF